MSADSLQKELAELAREARELLEWEAVIGGKGVPPVEIAESRRSVPDSGPEAGAEAARGDAPGPTTAPSTNREAVAAPAPAAEAPSEPPSPTPSAPAPAAPTPAAPAPAAPAARPQSPEDIRRRLAVMADEAAACTKCDLHEGRTRSVFARGNPETDLVFVGEGPGFHEDRQGLPFVGKAGQLLDKMVGAMGYGRDDVYICNVVKCRPPNNRTPLPQERAACVPFLIEQLELIQPKVVVALGRTAAEGLGLMDETTRGWRGRWVEWRGIPVMPTYHPAFLLRNPRMKRPVWEDLQKVMARLGRTPPQKRG